MNQRVPTTMFPAPTQFLLFWLQRTINTVAHQQNLLHLLPWVYEQSFITQKSDLCTSKPEKKCSQIREKLVTKGNLLLTKVKEDTLALYICAIALKLSPSSGTLPIDIATQIADRFSYLSSQELSDDPKKYFTLKAVPPGWLHLQLTDLGIATWLQSLASRQGCRLGREFSVRLSAHAEPTGAGVQQNSVGAGLVDNLCRRQTIFGQNPPLQLKTQIFPMQYAHARCCSLLRLAEREGIIVFQQVDGEQSQLVQGAIAPDTIPWLNEIGQLRLIHPAERSLISQLLSALDALYCPESSKNLTWEKLAQGISLSWEKFDRQCRIWGEVKREALELAQARLGLLMATQAMLQLLLEDCLGVPAPLEL